MVVRLQVRLECSVHKIRYFFEHTNLALKYNSAMADEVDPIGSISSHCVRRFEPSHS